MALKKRIEQRSFSGPADEAVVGVLVVADHFEQALSAVITAHGITSDQYNVLRILRGVHPEGHPRHEIARRMIRRAPDVTRMMDRLGRRKLIRRTRDPGDARLSVARITSQGLALLRRVDPDVEAVQRTLTEALTAAECHELGRLCDKLLRDAYDPEK